MKKATMIAAAALCGLAAHAGGILTNTNQSAAFLRMVARGASQEIDAVYSNPAGTAFMPEGWQLSATIQSVYQTRNIESTLALYPEGTRTYEGKASVPALPSVYAAYKKGSWGINGFFGIVGGGGKASFDDGLPMFDSKVMASLYAQSHGTITPDKYDINSAVSGRQYIYGAQLGASYRINKHLGVFAGGRMAYFSGNYSGYVEARLKAADQTLLNLELDCDQSGWGITPILGINYNVAGLTLAAKYEFKTSLNIANKTEKNSDPEGALADFKDGVNTPSDIPSMLSVAVGYKFTPRLRATLEYHFYDDKHAGMAHVDGGTEGKEKALTHGTSEFLAGAEFDINKLITVSAGVQRTDYGLSDGFQTNTAFSCDSWSVGLGAALNLSSKVKLNVGYFWTMYDDYTKSVAASATGGYNGTTMAGKDVYSRTNKVFGVGVDYKF